ncbi:MAG: leucine-rich repeat protein [Bacilli bacterium]|nr:leucine-rich repeat protein [Bacilli bacterium]
MKKILFLAASALSLLLSCGGPKGEGSSSPEPSSYAPYSSAMPSSEAPSSEAASSESVPSEPSSSEPAPLAEGYFYDADGHWKQREGDSSHERINYASHSLSDWEEDGDGLSRSCEVCGYSEHHSHEFGGYSYDDSRHWKEAICGHEAESERAPHSLERAYHLEGEFLVRVDSCGVCGYAHEEALSNEAGLAESIAYSTLPDGTASIAGLGDHWGDDTLIYPSSIDGKTVSTIRISGSWGNYPSLERGTVFLPHSVKVFNSLLMNRPYIDLVYDGTLEEWMNVQFAFPPSDASARLFLKDDEGTYRRLSDMVLPTGTTSFTKNCFYGIDLESFTCNPELLELQPMSIGTRSLRNVYLNEGLKTLSLSVFMGTGVSNIAFPSTLETVTGSLISVNHLYEVTIPRGMKASLNEYTFSRCPRLVALYDYRPQKTEFDLSKYGLLANEQSSEKLQFAEDNGYVFVMQGGEVTLLDYRGGSLRVELPTALHFHDEPIEQYHIHKTFFYAPSASGGYDLSTDDGAERYCAAVKDRCIVEATIPSSVTLLEDDVFQTGDHSLWKLFFAMGEEEMKARVPVGFFERPYLPPVYCLKDGQYNAYPGDAQ